MRPLHRLKFPWVGCGVFAAVVTLGYAQTATTGGAATNVPGSVPALSTNEAKLIQGRPSIPHRVVFNGVVTELNFSNRWFEVRGTNGTQRFSFRTNSNVLLTGSPIPMSDLRTGDRVGVVARVRTNDLPEILGVRVGARPPGQGSVKRTDPAPTD
jgi:hypothetical protein